MKEDFRIGGHPSGAVGFKHQLNSPINYGRHTIYLQAQDQTGRVYVSSPVKIFNIIDFPAPTITIPEDNDKTLNTNPIIAGVAFNGSVVKVFVDDKLDGEIKVVNHPSGVGYFNYPVQNNLTRGKYHKITAKALGTKGRISAAGNSVNILTQYYYIPPTLLKVKKGGDRPVISGVAHNNSTVKIFVDGQLDVSFVPENHSSGTLYFEVQLTKPLSYGVHQITAQAFDKNQKPSQLSNILAYTFSAPKEIEPAEQAIEPETEEKIPTKTETQTKEEGKATKEEPKQENLTDISVKEKKETGEIVEVIEPETEGKIKVPDEEDGKVVVKTEEEALPQDVSLPSATNWPLVLGLILLIGLAIIFMGWYLGQKRRLLNKGIDQLFSDEEFGEPDQPVKPKQEDKPAPSTAKTDAKPDETIPPPPPEI
jgi:hypothetical protein